MKAMLLSTFATFFISGCTYFGNIASVKNGVLDFDKSITVGKAFDNWSECDEKKWSEFESSNGRTIVQFECKSSKVRDFMQAIQSRFPKKEFENDTNISQTITTFQWVINNDNTFDLGSATRYWKWNDGAVYGVDIPNYAEKLLRKAYKNEVEYALSKLDGPEASSIAASQYENVAFIRRYGKQISPPIVSTPATAQKIPDAQQSIEKNIAVSHENPNEIWASIQKDSGIYLAKCTNILKSEYMNSTSTTENKAEMEAKVECNAKIDEIKLCMNNKNSTPDSCIGSITNTGD